MSDDGVRRTTRRVVLEQLRIALELLHTMTLDANVMGPSHRSGGQLSTCVPRPVAQWSTNDVDDLRFDRDRQLEQIIVVAGSVDDATATLAYTVVDRLVSRGIAPQPHWPMLRAHQRNDVPSYASCGSVDRPRCGGKAGRWVMRPVSGLIFCQRGESGRIAIIPRYCVVKSSQTAIFAVQTAEECRSGALRSDGDHVRSGEPPNRMYRAATSARLGDSVTSGWAIKTRRRQPPSATVA
jgi:hypothetical protein